MTCEENPKNPCQHRVTVIIPEHGDRVSHRRRPDRGPWLAHKMDVRKRIDPAHKLLLQGHLIIRYQDRTRSCSGVDGNGPYRRHLLVDERDRVYGTLGLAPERSAQ